VNLGREIVAHSLRSKAALKRFLDAGFDMDWLTDETDFSRAAIFSTNDLDAYKFIVRQFTAKRAVPTMDYFRHSFPAATYRLPEASGVSLDEALEWAQEDRQRVQLETTTSDLIDRVEEGQLTEAHDIIARAARIREAREFGDVHVVWDSPDWDIKPRIKREIEQGVVTGIPELDKSFMGWQSGDLVTYLGRPKAGKTSFLLLSALATYSLGYRVMFVSVEVPAGDDPTRPGIGDRLDAMKAGISYTRYSWGNLNGGGAEAEKLEAMRADLSAGDFHIIQPIGTYTIEKLENDIEQWEPDVVYVDGFYLMTDTESKKGGGSWEGHDNLAKDMKYLAMKRKLVLITSTQVRGKQLNKKKEIDNDAMMGGTSLAMWSTMVLGVNIAEDRVTHTISNTASRMSYLPTLQGHWDWEDCTFHVEEDEAFEEAEF